MRVRYPSRGNSPEAPSTIWSSHGPKSQQLPKGLGPAFFVVNDTSDYLEMRTDDGQSFCGEGLVESHVPLAGGQIPAVLVSPRIFEADLASLRPEEEELDQEPG